jgi:hypothetical protein
VWQRDYTYQIVIKDKTRSGGTSFHTWPGASIATSFVSRARRIPAGAWNNYLADDRNRVSVIGI